MAPRRARGAAVGLTLYGRKEMQQPVASGHPPSREPAPRPAGVPTSAGPRGEHAEINPTADIYLFGQEVNPDTFATCTAALFMKSSDGRDAERMLFGSTLFQDRLGAHEPEGVVLDQAADRRAYVASGSSLEHPTMAVHHHGPRLLERLRAVLRARHYPRTGRCGEPAGWVVGRE